MIACFLLIGNQPYSQLLVSSLKQLQCPIVQMSDLQTAPVPGVSEVIRLPFRVPLMLYRLKHLAQFNHDELLILDTDILCKGQVAEVWKQPFDIALTRRETLLQEVGVPPDMIYNTGVMFSRSQQFWRDCYDWLLTQPPSVQQWYGDQLAVAAIAPQYSVLDLPCAEFNWSPNSRQDTSNARFWHYKGRIRKKWLSELLSDSTHERLSPTTSAANPS